MYKKTNKKVYTTSTLIIPKEISGTYVHDYDILTIDKIIRAKLQEQVNEKTKLQNKLFTLQNKLLRSEVHNKQLEEEINNLRSTIISLENNLYLQKYEKDSISLLNQYKSLRGHIMVKYLDKEDDDSLDNVTLQRLAIIDNYLSIANDYIPIKLQRKSFVNTNKCVYCSNNLETSSDDRILRCTNCFNEYSSLMSIRLDKEIVANIHDESRENFNKIIKFFMGLQQPRPPDSLYEELDQYCIDNNLETGDMIKEHKLDNRGRREGTNIANLICKLKNIDRSEYYEDIYLIAHIYWGWLLHDISTYYDKMMYIYDKTQISFRNIPKEIRLRESALSTGMRLWRILQLCGYDCSMDEFRMPESPEAFYEADRVWKLICEGCADPLIYYIPLQQNLDEVLVF